MLHARRDADDAAPRTIVAGFHVVADGIAVRPESSRQCLVDDRHERRVAGVGLLEEPPSAQRRPDGGKVVGRHSSHARNQPRLPLLRLAALDCEDLLVVALAERRLRGQADCLDSRQAAHAVGELRVKLASSVPVLIVCQADGLQRHAADEHVLRPEARIDAQQLIEAAQQQAGANQKHDRQRELRDDERVGEPAARGRPRRAPAVLDGVLQVDARAAQCRRDAEEYDRHERHDDRERKHRRIERDGLQVVEAFHGHATKYTSAPRAEHQTNDRARQPEQQALDEQLPNDAPRARAEAAPQRDFPDSRAGAREQQVGDVGARDEKDHAHRGEHHEQRALDVADELARERRGQDDRRGWLGRIGIAHGLPLSLAPEVVVDPGNLPRGTLGRLPRRKAPERRVAPATERLRLDPDRHPQLSVIRKVESRRHDPHDGDGLAVERDALADDVRGAAEPPPPEAVAKDHDLVPAAPFFFSEKGAAVHGHPAEQREEVGGDDRTIQPLRLTNPRQREAGPAVARDRTERSTPRTHVHEEGIGIVDDRKPHLGGGSPEADDAIGIVEWQGTEDGRVDDAEDGDVGADANRQGEQGDRRERGTSSQGSDAVAHVVPESKEPAVDGRLPERRRARDRRTLERSERPPEDVRRRQLLERDAASLHGRDTRFQELAVAIVEVLGQFLDDVVHAGGIG